MLALACAIAVAGLDGLTMSELLGDSKMTPKRFANLFEDFKFNDHPYEEVEPPGKFLATESGDCIDYAVLADYVLKRKGYGTRLIRIEMVGKNFGHAVCYVTQSRAYLDYNNRVDFSNLEHSGPRIREIATRIADSFDANWTFAQEFTYDYETRDKHTFNTVVKTDPPEEDPDLATAQTPPQKPSA